VVTPQIEGEKTKWEERCRTVFARGRGRLELQKERDASELHEEAQRKQEDVPRIRIHDASCERGSGMGNGGKDSCRRAGDVSSGV
jgi:hypothetical protein